MAHKKNRFTINEKRGEGLKEHIILEHENFQAQQDQPSKEYIQ